MDKPSIGRIVTYVLNGGINKGEERPAVIARVWDPTSDIVQLEVFTDAGNDGLEPIAWRTSVRHSEQAREPGSWHWPDRIPG